MAKPPRKPGGGVGTSVASTTAQLSSAIRQSKSAAASVSTYVDLGALTWTADVYPLTITRGSFVDLASKISVPSQVGDITAASALPSGVAITSTPTWRLTATAGATLGTTTGPALTLVPSKRADFNTRAAGAGVVWWHAFDSAAEVNQFRWTGGIGSNPNAVGDGARCQYISTGGPSGGGFVRNLRGPGTTGDDTYWQRPLNPLTGATNGKGTDDPANGGTVPLASFNVSQGTDAQFNWDASTRPGWYGHVSYHNGTKFDGTDFYLQIRVRRATTGGSTGSGITGKNVWFSTTRFSYTVQELVTYGNSELTAVGQSDPFNIYQGYNYTNLYEVSTTANGTRLQLGSELVGVCDWFNNNLAGCWTYSTGWDTLLYHITPGRDGIAETRVEVWAQHDLDLFPAERGLYKKITDVIYPAHFDTSAGMQKGWNALLFGMYHNGASMPQFYQDYGDPIFSRSFIPAPTA